MLETLSDYREMLRTHLGQEATQDRAFRRAGKAARSARRTTGDGGMTVRSGVSTRSLRRRAEVGHGVLIQIQLQEIGTGGSGERGVILLLQAAGAQLVVQEIQLALQHLVFVQERLALLRIRWRPPAFP